MPCSTRGGVRDTWRRVSSFHACMSRRPWLVFFFPFEPRSVFGTFSRVVRVLFLLVYGPHTFSQLTKVTLVRVAFLTFKTPSDTVHCYNTLNTA